MKKSIFIIGLLLIAVGIFEFHPAVKDAQSYVSLENYENAQTPCQKLIAERPWYGTLNYWFFAWLAFVPGLVFSVSPESPAWIRASRVIIAAGICYALMNLAVHLQWDIRNAPFKEDPFNPDPLNGWRMDCANYAGDGFSTLVVLVSAWITACIYTGLCLIIWNFYHQQFSQEIMENYKRDIATHILFKVLKIYAVIIIIDIILLIVLLSLLHFTGSFLFLGKWVGPLLIPILWPLFVPLYGFFP
ncbi:MAG: hypothetical protein KDJ35_05490 [Alphaproteobacteria bacterium]|nr:hypothetical protein [Alphaproteobacteria bacterium]